jgi:glycosyltransferase involved in cell wall biosynthesis
LTSANLTTAGLELSVIIPTYNPDSNNLNATINGLRGQTLDLDKWELIIIDNNSTNGVLATLDITWHPNSSIIKEPKQGLTYSRIAGITPATGNVVVMVDDDNILSPDYLENMSVHFKVNPQIGSIGGKIMGFFNNYTPKKWTEQFWPMLAIRNYGNEPIISEPQLTTKYPPFSPVGAGMGVTRPLFSAYINEITKSGNQITDRSGGSLSSGGDNEINIQVLKQGFSVAFFPDLVLQHIIPPVRLTRNYLGRLNYESSISWIRLLLKYGICPWPVIPPYTVLLRKMKAWLKYKAWASDTGYIKWKGACGIFEALADKNE